MRIGLSMPFICVLLLSQETVGQATQADMPRLQAANPSAKCAALPDSGFFLDYQEMASSHQFP